MSPLEALHHVDKDVFCIDTILSSKPTTENSFLQILDNRLGWNEIVSTIDKTILSTPLACKQALIRNIEVIDYNAKVTMYSNNIINNVYIRDKINKMMHGKINAFTNNEYINIYGDVALKPRFLLPLIPLDDVSAIALWGVRSSEDLSSRRCRYGDIIEYIIINKELKLMKIVCLLCNSELDYISVCNVLLYTVCFGDEWFERWDLIGSFSSDIVNMTMILKSVSDAIKMHGCKIPDAFNYVECSGISGYRRLPFPGFDLMQEVKDYATGGIAHPCLPEEDVDRIFSASLFKLPIKPVKYMTFYQFLDSRIWSTSGSSSLGHYEVEGEGKVIRIKCKKNGVSDVYSTQELYDLCLASSEQTSSVLIKSELSKVRLAVASDLLTYLKMAWIAHLAGDYYEQWDSVVSGEEPNVMLDRLNTMVELCSDNWGMPFDYKGFEKQPETIELRAISRNEANVAEITVQNNCGDLTEFYLVRDSVDRSWTNSTLLARKGLGGSGGLKNSMILPVTGGLMSGLQLTARIGSGWNKTMTDRNLAILQGFGVSINDIVRYVKGDDSAFFCAYPRKLQMVEYLYRKMNIVGGVGKFGIIKSANEFLRCWVDPLRVHGYAGRLIPGLMQRKPWVSAPWTATNTLDAIFNTVQTLRRRLTLSSRLDCFWQHVSKKWCFSHKVPVLALSIPKSLGGLGYETWDGEHKMVPSLNFTPKLQLKFINITTKRRDFWLHQAKGIDLYITHEEADFLAQNDMNTLLSSDDVPEASRSLREKWKEEMKLIKFKVVRINTPVFLNVIPIKLLDIPDALKHMKRQDSSSFGSLSHEINQILSLKPLLNLKGWSVKDCFKYFPTVERIYRSEKNPHLGEFLDWYGGVMPLVSYSLSPLLVDSFRSGLAKQIKFLPRRGALLTLLGSRYAPMLENWLKASSRYVRVCQW